MRYRASLYWFPLRFLHWGRAGEGERALPRSAATGSVTQDWGRSHGKCTAGAPQNAMASKRSKKMIITAS